MRWDGPEDEEITAGILRNDGEGCCDVKGEEGHLEIFFVERSELLCARRVEDLELGGA